MLLRSKSIMQWLWSVSVECTAAQVYTTDWLAGCTVYSSDQTCSSQVVISPLFWTTYIPLSPVLVQCRNVQPVRKVQLHPTFTG